MPSLYDKYIYPNSYQAQQDKLAEEKANAFQVAPNIYQSRDYNQQISRSVPVGVGSSAYTPPNKQVSATQPVIQPASPIRRQMEVPSTPPVQEGFNRDNATPEQLAILNANTAQYNAGTPPTTYPRTDETITSPVVTPSVAPTTPTAPVVDEEALRKQEEERIATQIKAIEGVYAGEIAKAQKQGQGRVQQRTAISTVRGGAGSDFASAEKDVVEQANADIENAKYAQMNAEIASIRSKGGANAQAAIDSAYKNVQTKKAMADAYIADEKAKFTDAEALASRISQSGGTYDSLDPATRGLLEKYYGNVKNAKLRFSELGKEEKKAFTTVAPGSSLYDNNGKLIGTAPSAPVDQAKPTTVETDDGSVLQWDPTAKTWNKIYTGTGGGKEQKIVKINGEDYIQNADGSYTKPTLPTAPPADKVERASSVVTKIDNLLKTDDWKAGVGPVSSSLPDWASGKRNTAIANIEDIISSIALENLNLLKGPMSDKDIQFIKDASAGLRTNMSEVGFKAQLEKIRNKFEEVKNKAQSGQYETSTTTRMIGPDGIQYNVPNDQVEAFISVGGKRFNQVDGDTNKAIVKTVAKASSTVDDTRGGQCGTFVRKVAGIKVGDSYQSKLDAMDPTIKTPQPGMVFTLPYKDTGHIGIILNIKDGIATVKHSNYDLDERITTDQIPVSKMTGFTYPKLA